MSMEVETKSNLAAFYKALARHSGLETGKVNGLEYIMNPSGGWPSYLIGGEKISGETLKMVAEMIMAGRLPSFWIRALSPGDDFAARAGVYGIRQINYWTGIGMRRNEPYLRLPPDHESMAERIMGERELKEWTDVINQEVMTGKQIDFRLFLKAFDDPGFEFFRIVRGKKTAATLLGFREGNFIGLYMLSTRPEFRGRGYGSWMMCHAMDYYIMKGFRNFVGQASSMGLPIHKRLGYTENNRLGIYWMVGKY